MVRLIDVRSPEGNSQYLIVPTAEWTLSNTALNAPAAVSRPGEEGKCHYVTYVGGSYSKPVTGGALTLKENGQVKNHFYAHDMRGITFPFPVKISEGQPAELTLSAGGPLTHGSVTLHGFTL